MINLKKGMETGVIWRWKDQEQGKSGDVIHTIHTCLRLLYWLPGKAGMENI